MTTPTDATGGDAPAGASIEPGLRELFLGFSAVGLSGFGGVLPFARRMLVDERRWLSGDDFNSLLGLCQFLPGPNVVNLSVAVGARYRGVAGALVSMLGLMGAPMVIVLLLGVLYDHYGSLPQAQGMLRGIAAVGCGLLFATALRMAQALREKSIYLPFTVLVFVAVALLRWPMTVVMIVLLALSAAVAWRRQGRDDGAAR